MQNKRDLPWRNTTDPYMIWLSEIILQQTRVTQGLPYFNKFKEEFPTIFDLAEANESHVLRLWQGLGYYSRARNLHQCAKEIVSKYAGKFPENYEQILKLKGIGKYTAAAISSFAFNQTIPVVDGNVFRVLSRIFGIANDISTSGGQKEFYVLASELIDHQDPYHYNQAIMEFGAIHCTPKNPDCSICIFQDKCYAYQHKKQDQLPVKSKKVKVRSRFFNYLVLKHQSKILMKRRSDKDIWKGLYDFELWESKSIPSQMEVLENNDLLKKGGGQFLVENVSAPYVHQLTHQKITAMFYKIEFNKPPDMEKNGLGFIYGFYDLHEIKDLPKPILIDNYLNDHIF